MIYKTSIYFYVGSLHNLLGKSRTVLVYINHIILFLFHGNSCGCYLIILISRMHIKIKRVWKCERTVVISDSISRLHCNIFYLKKNSGNNVQKHAETRLAWRKVRQKKIVPLGNNVFGLIWHFQDIHTELLARWFFYFLDIDF